MIDFSTNTISVSSPLTEAYNPSSKISDKDQNYTDITDNNKDVDNEKEAPKKQSPDELSADEIRVLSKLKQRDREVRAHEQAHISAGGRYIRSGAHFEYQEGPDGRNYAIGGEVQIDTSKVPGDPEATISKMQVVRRAALAPASPSPQDRSVASQATRIENRMRTEILLERYKESAAFETGRKEASPSFPEKTPNQSNTPGANINFFG